MKSLGVGVIGPSIGAGSWAARATVPALLEVEGFDLRAVATTRGETARAAAEAFAADAAYDDYRELIADPRVELVVVAVRVPRHFDLVAAALRAGKSVFCEWPLAVNFSEAADLAGEAEALGLKTAIGLQARFRPTIQYLRDLIDNGYVGDVMASVLVSSGIGWGPVGKADWEYLYDARAGATPLAITGMHGLDAVEYVLQTQATSLSGRLGIGRTSVSIEDGGGNSRRIAPTTPDQVAFAGLLEGGIVASHFIRGGTSRAENLHWEINGTEGDLILTTPGSDGNVQNAALNLRGGRHDDERVSALDTPPRYSKGISSGLDGTQTAYVKLFEQLYSDMRQGSNLVPDFSHAARLHQMIDDLQAHGHAGTCDEP